jgi:tRNA A-37 threonylcarbamoyl transferase component Bud32
MRHINKHSDLTAIDYTQDEPFIFSVKGKLLTCERLLRLVPGKRMVFSGKWKRQKVVVKIFLTDKRGEAVRQEKDNLALLERNNFLVPELLYGGRSDIKRVRVLIFHELATEENALSIFDEEDKAALKKVSAIQKQVLKLHRYGFIQEDLHVDNFLFTEKGIYLLDAARIKQVSSDEITLKNIALFYAQLPIRFDANIQDLFSEYCEVSHRHLNVDLENRLFEHVKMLRRKRGEAYVKKAFRRSTEFAVFSKFNLSGGYKRQLVNEQMLALIKKPERFMKKNPTEILKAGNTCTVFKVKVGEEFIVVKRFNIKSMTHYALHCLRVSRAEINWRVANLLRLFGVQTPEPLGYLEKDLVGLGGRSYYFMRYEKGDLLRDHFENTIDETVVNNVADLFLSFQKLLLSHGDAKATNFLVENKKISVLDLDSVTWYKKERRWKKAFAKDLARFRKNWLRSHRVLKAFDVAFREKGVKS